jgi:hypothetical protein
MPWVIEDSLRVTVSGDDLIGLFATWYGEHKSIEALSFEVTEGDLHATFHARHKATLTQALADLSALLEPT